MTYIFFILAVPLKLPDFRIVETNLWWSEIPVIKVLDNLSQSFLLVSIRSMHVGVQQTWYTTCLTSCQRLKTQDLRKYGNVRKISNLGGDLVSSLPSRNLTLTVAVKNTQKQISNFSCPVQFYWDVSILFQILCLGLQV